jgi:hypothetical protein
LVKSLLDTDCIPWYTELVGSYGPGKLFIVSGRRTNMRIDWTFEFDGILVTTSVTVDGVVWRVFAFALSQGISLTDFLAAVEAAVRAL